VAWAEALMFLPLFAYGLWPRRSPPGLSGHQP
jgi:hypothetical protein